MKPSESKKTKKPCNHQWVLLKEIRMREFIAIEWACGNCGLFRGTNNKEGITYGTD
jgi:hypothetical protein